MLVYDPPSGWMYGFPKPYMPLPGEKLKDTLIRDGYPQKEIDAGGDEYTRFIGERNELERLFPGPSDRRSMHMDPIHLDRVDDGVLMTKNKHPVDRAERRKIDEAKKNNRETSKKVRLRSPGAVSSDDASRLENS